jgi:RNA polymerase sigma-70 factor, ECF subfamily
MGAARTSTFDLVERFRSGDAAAFRELYEKCQARLAVLVHYRLGASLRPLIDTDDILQETFAAAARDIGGFEYRTPGSFFRWLASIATHAIEDAGRRAAARRRDGGQRVPLRSASHPGGIDPADSLTPSRILFGHERVRDLMRRLDALPEQYREVILLAKVEGLSTAEISAQVGQSREAVALLLHRALTRVRQDAAQP